MKRLLSRHLLLCRLLQRRCHLSRRLRRPRSSPLRVRRLLQSERRNLCQHRRVGAPVITRNLSLPHPHATRNARLPVNLRWLLVAGPPEHRPFRRHHRLRQRLPHPIVLRSVITSILSQSSQTSHVTVDCELLPGLLRRWPHQIPDLGLRVLLPGRALLPLCFRRRLLLLLHLLLPQLCRAVPALQSKAISQKRCRTSRWRVACELTTTERPFRPR